MAREIVHPFDRPCKEIATPCFVATPRGYEPDLFFDGDRFMAYLAKTYSSFDVATYSISIGQPLKNVDRLITGLQDSSSFQAKQKKRVPNNHVKLFLCFDGKGRLKDVFLGSQNLTFGTNYNLMYRVRPRHKRPLLTFFNSMWNAQ